MLSGRSYNGSVDEQELRTTLQQAKRRIEKQDEAILRQRGWLRKKDVQIAVLEKKLEGGPSLANPFLPEDLLWIFGSPRSGTTWLMQMMSEISDWRAWDEPGLGDLFGNFYERARPGQKKARRFVFGEPARDVYLKATRAFVLESASGRFGVGARLVVKEPSGSVGAPLLSAALPESKLVAVVRDPRDVVASAIDARREGSWLYKKRTKQGVAIPEESEVVRERSETYRRSVERAVSAYRNHPGPRALVRYEDLLTQTLAEIKRICSATGVGVSEYEVVRAVQKHSWENIPEEEKGAGKFYRKGLPGGWRDDLTKEQVKIVENITAPLLHEFYSA